MVVNTRRSKDRKDENASNIADEEQEVALNDVVESESTNYQEEDVAIEEESDKFGADREKEVTQLPPDVTDNVVDEEQEEASSEQVATSSHQLDETCHLEKSLIKEAASPEKKADTSEPEDREDDGVHKKKGKSLAPEKKLKMRWWHRTSRWMLWPLHSLRPSREVYHY